MECTLDGESGDRHAQQSLEAAFLREVSSSCCQASVSLSVKQDIWTECLQAPVTCHSKLGCLGSAAGIELSSFLAVTILSRCRHAVFAASFLPLPCYRKGWADPHRLKQQRGPTRRCASRYLSHAGFQSWCVVVTQGSSLTPLVLVSRVLFGRMFYFLPMPLPLFLYNLTLNPLIWNC